MIHLIFDSILLYPRIQRGVDILTAALRQPFLSDIITIEHSDCSDDMSFKGTTVCVLDLSLGFKENSPTMMQRLTSMLRLLSQ